METRKKATRDLVRKLLAGYMNKQDDFILYDVYIDDGFTGTNFVEVR